MNRETMSLIHDYERLEMQIQDNAVKLQDLKDQYLTIEDAKQFLISFTEDIREKIKVKLESLANSALRAIFTDKVMEFRIISNRAKQGMKYDLYIMTDGALTPIHDAKGGGVLDVITLSLRISFLKLFSGKLRQTMLLDEPFKNLDSDRVVFAVEWLKQISKELEMQFIVITHINELKDNADKLISLTIENGISVVGRAS